MSTDLKNASLGEMQARQSEWSNRNFGTHDWRNPLMGMVEELGELHHHLLKQQQGIRGTWEEHEAKARDSVGDIVVFMMDFCTERGWSFQRIVEETLSEVLQRDWKADPHKGVTATEAVQA